MKKSFFSFAFLFLFVAAAIAQKPFEGTIKFDYKVMGSAAEMMQAFMPTGSTHKVKGEDYLISMEGGMMSSMLGNMLIKGKEGNMYFVFDSEKTAYKMTKEDLKQEEEPAKPVITKEDETSTIAGYNCQKYMLEMESPQGPMTLYVWATKDLSIPHSKTPNTMGTSSLFIEGVDGVVLKKMTSLSAMGMDITTVETANSVVPEKMNKKLFIVPKSYTMKTGKDFTERMQSMGGQ